MFVKPRPALLPVEPVRRLAAEGTTFLCQNCSKFDLWDREEDAPTYLCNQQEKNGFLESAREGCYICGLVLELVSRSIPLKQLTSGYNIHFRDHLLLGFKVSFTIDEAAMNEIGVTTYLAPDDIPPPGYPLGRRAAFPRSDDPRCFSILKDWIDHCEKHHTRCSGNTNAKIPARLLEIKGSGQQHVVRLVNTNTVNVPYMTLSYCWGRGDRRPPMLLSSNVTEWFSGVPASSLPHTFQDAARVVQQLGLSHIWIDSLCIFQDSAEDKLSELSRMDEIYANSYLTLAATDGKDSFAGLFQTREHFPSAKVSWEDHISGQTYSVHLKQREYQYEDELGDWSMMDQPKDSTLKGCLNERAWTFQERVLSPRIVHFTKDQLIWECNCRTTYERSDKPDYDFDHESFQLQNLLETDQKSSLAQIIHMQADETQFYQVWYRLLEVYSARKMSFDDDKINAIKGVAAVMCHRLGSSLIHGIWDHQVREGLLWNVNRQVDGGFFNPNDPSIAYMDGEARLTTCAVPSWSWAKTHGLIQTNWQFDGDLIKQCGSDAIIDSTQMEAGIICLEGLCSFGRFQKRDASHRLRRLKFESCTGTLNADYVELTQVIQQPDKSPEQLQEMFSDLIDFENNIDAAFDPVPTDGGLHGQFEGVVCIRISTKIQMAFPDVYDSRFIVGLAVEPTGEDGTFKRVGLFSIAMSKNADLSVPMPGWERRKITLI